MFDCRRRRLHRKGVSGLYLDNGGTQCKSLASITQVVTTCFKFFSWIMSHVTLSSWNFFHIPEIVHQTATKLSSKLSLKLSTKLYLKSSHQRWIFFISQARNTKKSRSCESKLADKITPNNDFRWFFLQNLGHFLRHVVIFKLI